MQTITIGFDVAKNVFHVHGVSGEGASERVLFSKRLGRGAVRRFFATLPASLVGIEACGSAHYWGRELQALGHEVRLMPTAYVKAFVKRNKTDARDAEAICEAVRRPTMRFVPIKSQAQQCERALHRARDLLVRQRTQLMNAMRAMLAEMGIVAAQGNKGFAALLLLVERQDGAIPRALVASVTALARQCQGLAEEVLRLEREIAGRAAADPAARRLMTIPAIGAVTAHAIVAAIGDGRRFASGRDFAAWLGLTPKQMSSGGKQRSLRISRAGDASLRRLFTLGAASRLRHLKNKPEKAGPWLAGVMGRRPTKVAVVAQAAKTARIAWAVLTSGQDYRAQVAVA